MINKIDPMSDSYLVEHHSLYQNFKRSSGWWRHAEWVSGCETQPRCSVAKFLKDLRYLIWTLKWKNVLKWEFVIRNLSYNDCKSKRIYVDLNYSSITASNSPNPSRVHIRLCKHWKRFLLPKDLTKTYNNNISLYGLLRLPRLLRVFSFEISIYAKRSFTN